MTTRVECPIDRLVAVVESEPLDLTRLPYAATSVTTVVLDIHDSDRKAVEMAGDRWSLVVTAHSTIVRRHTIRARGLELASWRDAFALAFTSALHAATCMVDIQRATHALSRSRPADAVQVRAGAHTSDAGVRADPNLLRQHIGVAAALANAARGGELLVTGIVREIVELHAWSAFDPPRRLSSESGARVAHPVRWAVPSHTTPTVNGE